jgi:probable rRNA maturation factor
MGTKRKRSVQIYNPCKALEVDDRAIESTFQFLDGHAPYSIPDGALSLAFLEAPAHNQLHDEFLNDPSPTDVITFPGDPEDDIVGEICVSIDTAYSYAKTHKLDFSQELTLYLVHGWLHLAGFNDSNDEDRQAMKKEEQVCMSMLETNSMIPMFKYLIDD